MRIKTLIIDDHEFYKKTCRQFLEGLAYLQVVGEGSNGKDAVALASKLKPHLIVMDINMPVLDGIGACNIIKAEHPQIKIILYSMHLSESEVISLDATPDIFLAKDHLFTELPGVIDKLLKNESLTS